MTPGLKQKALWLQYLSKEKTMRLPPKPPKTEKEALQKWWDDIQRHKLWPEYSGFIAHPRKGIPVLFGGMEDE